MVLSTCVYLNISEFNKYKHVLNVKFIVPLLIFSILWGLNVSPNPENRKSHLSRLLACLFFSGFVFLLSSCKSLLWALLWQVKIKRSHRHWQPRGPRGGEEASVELFYTNATTPPARAEFTTSCKTHFPSELGATAKPAFIHSVDPSVNNIEWSMGPRNVFQISVFLSSASFQGEDCPVTRVLLADEWPCVLLTSAAS